MNRALVASKRMDWRTPKALYEYLQAVFGRFDLDPATSRDNPLRTRRFYTRRDDGLSKPWRGRVFVNPPYGRHIPAWIEKAIAEVEAERAIHVVMLLPARTDTAWWQRCRLGEITYLRGRLTFEGARHGAPFPSAIVVFRPRLPGSMEAPR